MKSRELFVPCTKIRHIPSIICVVVCILLSGLPTVHRQQMQKYRNKSEQYDNNSPSHFFQEVCISSSNHNHYVTDKIEDLQIIQILDQRRVESTTWKKNLPPFKTMLMENDKPAITRFQMMVWIWFTIIIYLSILFSGGYNESIFLEV